MRRGSQLNTSLRRIAADIFAVAVASSAVTASRCVDVDVPVRNVMQISMLREPGRSIELTSNAWCLEES